MAKRPRLQPPYRGVTNATANLDTPEQFTRPDGELNCRVFTGPNDQPQYGTRPRLRRVFPQQFGKPGARRVQGIGRISRASAVTSFTAGVGTTITPDNATPRLAGLVSLNVGVVATNAHALREAFLVNGTGSLLQTRRDGAPSAQSSSHIAYTGGAMTPAWVAMHPSGTLAVAAFNFTESSQNRCALVFIDPALGNTVATKVIAPAGEATGSPDNVATLAFCWTAEALWIARGTQMWYVPTPVLADRARIIDGTDAPKLATADTSRPLAQVGRIVALTCYSIAGRTMVWGAFEGATGTGQFANPAGSIDATGVGKHFRAGLFHAEQLADQAAYTYRLANQALPDSEPSPIDAYVETDTIGTPVPHNAIRLSQWLARAPRGALPQAVAADPSDGSVYVAFTNQGYGPNSSFPPNSSVPYTTLAKFNTSGSLIWEADTASGIGGESGGYVAGIGVQYACDVPDEAGGANPGTTNRDGPAIRALVCDGFGAVYAAGRINSGRYNVFCLAASSGQTRWRQRTESNNPTNGSPAWATVGAAARGTPRNGLAIDPGDNQLVVVGRRNNTHGPQDSPNLRSRALMWKLGSVDGSFSWWFGATNDDTEADPAGVCAAAGVAVYACSSFTDV